MCERKRKRFCVAIVTCAKLSSGFRPSMPHSHSAALPAILSIPPSLSVSFNTSLSLSFSLFCVYSFSPPQTVALKAFCQIVQRCQNQWELKHSNTTEGSPDQLLTSHQRFISVGMRAKTNVSHQLMRSLKSSRTILKAEAPPPDTSSLT